MSSHTKEAEFSQLCHGWSSLLAVRDHVSLSKKFLLGLEIRCLSHNCPEMMKDSLGMLQR